ncbi:hypothetical protein TUMEXPCC7403_25345 [Tumidithrix helvetica PCC 7403]|uniref:hypothetical protein n=1 Tax=Tumidithrix helvetica TaxID=3457545 RepID=UPI003CA6E55E
MSRPAPKLTINLAEGSVSISSFSAEAARELQAQLNQLMEKLKLVSAKPSAEQSGTKVKAAPQPPLEYRHIGEVFLEVFCNPNIWATPFAAKVLITVRDERIRITTEASLNRLLEDVSQYLEAVEG